MKASELNLKRQEVNTLSGYVHLVIAGTQYDRRLYIDNDGFRWFKFYGSFYRLSSFTKQIAFFW